MLNSIRSLILIGLHSLPWLLILDMLSMVSSVPTRTLFDAHADGGVAAVALTHDARFLATLSAAAVQV